MKKEIKRDNKMFNFILLIGPTRQVFQISVRIKIDESREEKKKFTMVLHMILSPITVRLHIIYYEVDTLTTRENSL